ncbi:histone acetyltransferase type B catalytic subunit [Fusarium pseudoanthophilum]|uniref:Histone acetyltransferase type B catalytic subunit n=1 Tax=Fusarium pseudoanthophilum TaxID=48495 RepID=A0A8H5PC82_9HYPO|nr:histone acetyltransferase type B catalytic subunit [Fusarium pseudoanthophilum]
MANIEEWLANANEAIHISLVSPSESGLQHLATFNPRHTYSIFGEEEQIFGYKDLKVSLRFRANDMRPHLKTSYSKKFNLDGGPEPTDVAAVLKEGNHLPKIAFVTGSDFEESSKLIGDNWVPPGTLHATFDSPDGEYEIWRGNLADPAIQQLNSRLQIFVPLFIEGGTYIGQDPEMDSTELDLSDADRWTFFALYQKRKVADKTSYVFVGYSTIYRFYYFQPPTPPASPRSDEWELPNGEVDLSELPSRTRLSQFVILPPFQGKGNGARLYKTIFEHYHKIPQTYEFTVEDPNEAFDDLRDICDLQFLRTMPDFNDLRLDTSVTLPKKGTLPKLIVGSDKLETIRLQAKIAPRQFGRVLEMHLMSQLPKSVRPTMDIDGDKREATQADKLQSKIWSLIVKQRLYRHNKDVLSQIEPHERVEKLDDTLQGVGLEYARILAALERSAKHSQSQTVANGKRKLGAEGTEQDPGSKKARVEDS